MDSMSYPKQRVGLAGFHTTVAMEHILPSQTSFVVCLLLVGASSRLAVHVFINLQVLEYFAVIIADAELELEFLPIVLCLQGECVSMHKVPQRLITVFV